MNPVQSIRDFINDLGVKELPTTKPLIFAALIVCLCVGVTVILLKRKPSHNK